MRSKPDNKYKDKVPLVAALTGAEQPLWTDEQVATYLGVSPKSLPRWRVEGRSPPFVKLAYGRTGLVRYRPIDVINWVADQMRLSTSDRGNSNRAV